MFGTQRRLPLQSGGSLRARRRSRAFQPRSETLDPRLVPAITYHGGPVIPHVEVYNVFYGRGWNGNPGPQLRNNLDRFQAEITRSPYLAQLGEYGVGQGKYGGDDLVTGIDNSPAAGKTVTETDIQRMLASEILAGLISPGHLPDENGQRVYFVYLAPNLQSGRDLPTKDNPLGSNGHHGSFQMTIQQGFIKKPETIYYAVIVNPIGNESMYNHPELTTFQELTVVSSHELAEAVTDPDLRQSDKSSVSGGSLAWWDSDNGAFIQVGLSRLWRWNPDYGKEIGDMVSWQYDDFIANGFTYTVQKEWSNYFNKGILADGNEAAAMNLSPSALLQVSTIRHFIWNNGGKTTSIVTGIGKAIRPPLRIYVNFELSPNDFSGWFTINT